MFAGHDTTTSTLSFMFYELARNPRSSSACSPSRTRCCRTAGPTAAQLISGELRSSRWCSRRPCASTRPPGSGRAARSSRSSSKATACPGAHSSTTAPGPATTYPTCSPTPRSSAPSASRPRPAPPCPKGAYVPFGGGSRTCIGMRFGQLEVRTIATLILSRFSSRSPRTSASASARCPRSAPSDGLPTVHPTAATAPRSISRRCLKAPRALRGARTGRRPAAQRRLAHAQPVAERLLADDARAHPFDVHVRVGEQGHLERFHEEAARAGRPACLRSHARPRRPRRPTPNSPPLARTSTSPPPLRSSFTPKPAAAPLSRRRRSTCAARRSALPRFRKLASLSRSGPADSSGRHVHASQRRALPTAASPVCAGLSDRLRARTLTESGVPPQQLNAGHALTLTLCTLP